MSAHAAIRVGRVVPSRPDLPFFDAAHDRLVLQDVRSEAGGLKTFVFAAESGAPFRFLPGQAITLAVPVDGEVLHRTFTISSSPTRTDRIELSIKAIPGGRATRFMHEVIAAGTSLKAIGPVGRFTLAHHPAPQILLASAGSGITPMLSMLRWLADRGETADIVFLHHARTPGDIPFRVEIEAIDRAMPSLTLALSVTAVPSGESWIGSRGRIDRPRVRLAVPDLSRREVFCCGPEGFTDTLRRIHRAEGGEPGRFHTETFHQYGLAAPAIVETAPPASTDIVIDLDGRQLVSGEGETLLDSMRRQGVSISTGCRSGVCGTCRLRLVEGEVEMQHQGGLTARDERAGYVLACCSRPRTSVALVSG